jgi:hypothetical protein
MEIVKYLMRCILTIVLVGIMHVIKEPFVPIINHYHHTPGKIWRWNLQAYQRLVFLLAFLSKPLQPHGACEESKMQAQAAYSMKWP